MYSIIIADDEALERKALRSIIRNQVPEIGSIEEAENGQVALDKARKLMPDIMLLDIKMPRVNGIDVAREVKTILPDCKIILLSGYTYFNYAREAVNIGIQDFLVKPVEDEELVSALQVALQSLEKGRFGNVRGNSGDERLDYLYQCLEREFVSSVALRQIKEPHLSNYLEALEIHADFCVGLILSGKLAVQIFTDEEEQQIRALVQTCFDKDRSIAMRIDKHLYVLLFLSSYRPYTVLLDQLQHLYSKLAQALESPFSISAGAVKTSAMEIFESFNEARRMFGSNEDITMYRNLGQGYSDLVSLDAETLLCEKLMQGDRDNSLVLLSDLYQLIEKNSRDFAELKVRVYNLLVILSRRMNRDMVSKDSLVFHYQLDLLIKEEEVKSYLFDQLQEMLDQVANYYNNANKVWKQQIILYLSQNFREETTLEELASLVGFSTSYLSRIFKNEFGMNFCTYVNHLRVEEAKKLLLKGPLSIKEIAYSLGFSDANYFARVFKKETGVNASQYQKVVVYPVNPGQ
jgi:two-component system response regulator YesN